MTAAHVNGHNNDRPTIALSMFTGHGDKEPKPKSLTLSGLADMLATPRRTPCTLADCKRSECAYKNGDAWSPAMYRVGDTRLKANVLAVTMLGLDIDHVLDDVLAATQSKLEPYGYVGHATHSDRPGDRCVRFGVLVSRPVSAGEWPAWRPAALAYLGIADVVDSATKDASRLFYSPSRPSDADYFYVVHDGAALDVDAVLATVPKPEPKPDPTPHVHVGDDQEQLKRALAYLEKVPPAISGSGGHNALFAATCWMMHGFGLDDATVRSLIVGHYNDRCDPPWSERDLDHKIREARENADTGKWRIEDRPAPQKKYSGPEPRARDIDDVDTTGETVYQHEDRSDDLDDEDDDLDDVPPPSDEDAPRGARAGKPSIATMLVDLACRESELWQSTDGDAYATLTVKDHREHVRIGTPAHRQWLARLAWQKLSRAVGDSPIRSACMTLAGLAAHDGERHHVHVRVAGVGDRILVDLCDSEWRAIEIDAQGWRVVASPDVRFTRRKAMSALCAPVQGGTLDELRKHVKITDESWPLVAGWLVGAMSPRGPYPALVFRGQHGAGKSHSARVLRSLVDPSIAPIRSEPREPRDLVITAKASHVAAYDNISSIPPWLSDGLCRLATGGGYAARTLYTDEDETVIDVQRPVILTGITDVVTAPDLLDRCLLVELDAISKVDRRTERVLNARWSEAQPSVLGALCSAVSEALREQDRVKIDELPRLADWATWATAAEPSLGLERGAIIAALDDQAGEATEIALDASIIAQPIRELLLSEPLRTWKGSSGDLLAALNRQVDLAVSRDKSWPKTARALAGALARIAPAMMASGIEISKAKPGEVGRGKRGWRLRIVTGEW